MSLSPNEFWLSLHALAQAYQNEGLTPDEQAENIVEQFSSMPPTARRELKGELDTIVVTLTDLAVLVAAARRRLESFPRESVTVG